MKSRLTHPALLILLLLATTKIAAQQQVLTLKAGIMHTTIGLPRIATIAIENRLGSRLTFQPEFGIGFRNWRNPQARTVTHHYHFGLDMRAYLLLRQGQQFTGLYIAPFFTHDRLTWDVEGYTKKYHLMYATAGGLGIGFQQHIGTHLRIDGNLRMGATPNIRDIDYNHQGGITSQTDRGFNFILIGALELGYAF